MAVSVQSCLVARIIEKQCNCTHAFQLNCFSSSILLSSRKNYNVARANDIANEGEGFG